MMNPALEARKQRLEKVKQLLETLIPVEFTKALAIIEINTGLRRETAKDYLITVVNFNNYIINEGIIEKIPA